MLDVQLQALAAHCTSAGSELVVLPEMPFDDWLAATKVLDGPRWALSVKRHLDALERLTELPALSVIASRPVVDDSGVNRNRGFCWSAEKGLTDLHDKAHLPDEEGYWEAQWYKAGNANHAVFEAAGGCVGMLICSELWFLEHARKYGQQQAQLVCLARATPAFGDEAWLAAGQTAAVVAGAYCLSSNQYRPAGVDPDMGGMGWIIDPDGVVLATTTSNAPFITLEIDLAYAESAKSSYPRYLR